MNFEENELLKKALDFAQVSLAGQKKESGEEVFDHCKKVADILVRFKISDPVTLSAAILHHSISDGAATILDIKKEFGEDILGMLLAFESLRIIKGKVGMDEELVENLRKMFLTLSKDLRVVLIKLADILDNLRTLDSLEFEKREEVARETLEIFAPLAERLGMSGIRGELQDLAFPYLYPSEYIWVKNYMKGRLSNLDKMMLQIKAKLLTMLKEEGVEPDIQSRVKHIYSLYTKLLRPEIDKDITKVYDLVALRILVDTEKECYEVLGIVQKIFKVFPGPVSDYIAHPKPNGYQSIHVKVYGSKDIPFEIQIRTKKMHELAEYGLAAHWNYADKKSSGMSDEQVSKGFATSAEKLDWVKSLSMWQKEITNNSEFLKTVKTDLFGERIFCFTPKGDVKDLPEGATPIDFAYSVHTEMAARVSGAKVNNKVVGLDYKLLSGDTVELLINKDANKKPNRDWLNFVVTSTARKKIKKFYF